jgi:hypothetical protein
MKKMSWVRIMFREIRCFLFGHEWTSYTRDPEHNRICWSCGQTQKWVLPPYEFLDGYWENVE